jgi:O-antigen/teichoic acid export membrane protein
MESVRALLAKPLVQKAVQNFGWLVFERAVRLVLGVLVGLVVARYLGPTNLGSLSYAIALVTLLGFLPELGLDTVLRRELLKSPARTPELMATGFLLRLGSGVLTYAGLAAVVAAGFGGSAEERRLLFILGLILFQPAAYLPELWLQAQLQAKRSTLVQLGALVCSSVVRLWLVSSGASLAAFAWVIVGELVLCTVGYQLATRGLGLRFQTAAAKLATMRWLLAEAWPLMFANLAVIVYLRIDEVMLRHLTNAQTVGIYAAAVKLSELCYFVPTALATSVLPALLRARQQDPAAYAKRQQQYYDLSAAVAYALSVLVALVAPWVVRLAYGAEFADAAPILTVHIWASVFVFLGVARGQWLVNEGLQKFYLAATLAGAVANVLINLVLIPRWGGLGAAYATVISYALAGWFASYCHPAVRVTAHAQTRALLIPFRAWRYLRRT